MATFNFGEAANTTLQTIDAKWTEATSGHAVTDGSGNVWSSASPNSYTERHAWYPNSQGDTQESEIDVVAQTAGTHVYAAVLKSSGVLGYEARATGGTTLQLRRLGAYITDATVPGFDPTAADYTLKIAFNSATGVVKVYLNGVEKISYTDGTPLTGGSPGFRLYGNGETTNRPKISRWTDNVAASGPNYQPSCVWME